MSIRTTYLHKILSTHSDKEINHVYVRTYIRHYTEGKQVVRKYSIDNIDIISRYNFKDQRFYQEWQPSETTKLCNRLEWMKTNNKS